MKTFIQTLRLSLLATVLFTTETSAGTVTDLFVEPNGWKSWAQREEVAPKFELRQPTGSSETASRRSLSIRSSRFRKSKSSSSTSSADSSTH